MKKTCIRLLCCAVTLCLLLSAVPFAIAAEKKSDCGKDFPYYPTIIVP